MITKKLVKQECYKSVSGMSLPVSFQPRFQKSDSVLPGWKTKLEMSLTQMFEKTGSKIKTMRKIDKKKNRKWKNRLILLIGFLVSVVVYSCLVWSLVTTPLGKVIFRFILSQKSLLTLNYIWDLLHAAGG